MNGPDSRFDPYADCCFKPGTSCDWTLSTWSCCTTEKKCQEGEGHCDYDSECEDGLECGHQNCHTMPGNAGFSIYADCCKKKEGKKSEVICCITVFGIKPRMVCVWFITISNNFFKCLDIC